MPTILNPQETVIKFSNDVDLSIDVLLSLIIPMKLIDLTSLLFQKHFPFSKKRFFSGSEGLFQQYV